MRLAHDSLGGAAVVAVVGEIDRASSPRLSHVLKTTARTESGRILVDLTDASFIDSTGVAALIEASDSARISGGRFAVVVPPDTYLSNTLEQCGAGELFPLVSTRHAGVATLLG